MSEASFEVTPAEAGKRLDEWLSGRVLGLTRSQAERLIRDGGVLVHGRAVAPGRRVVAGDMVRVSLPVEPESKLLPERIPLEILFEDDDVLVVNKPRGMVVHPGTGRTSGTLVHALLAHTDRLAAGSGERRPGIVHRLDRGTSGLLVVAKSDRAYQELSRQIQRRLAERRYLALVWGDIREDRIHIDVPIGRHEREHTRMAAVHRPSDGRKARTAETDVTVAQRFGEMTLVEARLGTGRTHQIRVHLAHIGHPVVGDPVYGLRQSRRREPLVGQETRALIQALGGQALHAHLLRFRHPITGQEVSFSVAMPPEMARLVARLSAVGREGGR